MSYKISILIVFYKILNDKGPSWSAYVPGEPGGPWTQQELVTVRAKLFEVKGFH